MECPSLGCLTDDDLLNLEYTKKVQAVEKDMRNLYEFCLKKAFTAEQIKMCLSPLHLKNESLLQRIWFGSSRSLMKLSLFAAIIGIVVAWPVSYKFLCVHLRIFSIKVLPYWDWTKVNDIYCLIDNPYISEEEDIDATFCFGCTNFTENPHLRQIDKFDNVDSVYITNEYLAKSRPFIVTDPVKDWPKQHNNLELSLERIKELYNTHPSLMKRSSLEDCECSSTIWENTTVYDYIEMLQNDTLPPKYHVAWENCAPHAAKVYRSLTKRPYFLPPMAQISRANQIIVANGRFEGHTFKIPQQPDSATWMIVLSGKMEIVFSPLFSCVQYGCQEIRSSLSEKQAVVVPNRIWSMEYSPVFDGTTLAFASTVIWDDHL